MHRLSITLLSAFGLFLCAAAVRPGAEIVILETVALPAKWIYHGSSRTAAPSLHPAV